MQRVGYLFDKLVTRENFEEAFNKFLTLKPKDKPSIIKIQSVRDEVITDLIREISDGTYSLDSYKEFTVHEGHKDRVIQSLKYRDRIAMTAIINVIGDIINKSLILDTYSSIKGKGLHLGLERVKRHLREDVRGTQYCLKIDLRHYYENVDQEILLGMLRGKFKDERLMNLLTMIIHSYKKGISIGYHSSQYFGNFYLSGFDHYMKDVLKVKHYFRYCDDIVVLGETKEYLWDLLGKMREYLEGRLKLVIKPNYQVFPVEARGIDFLGYVIKHRSIRLRKSIKKRAEAHLNHCKSETRIVKLMGSFYGWSKHCSNKSLLYNTLLSSEKLIKIATTKMDVMKDLGLKPTLDGKTEFYPSETIKMTDVLNKNIRILSCEVGVKTKYCNKSDSTDTRAVLNLVLIEKKTNEELAEEAKALKESGKEEKSVDPWKVVSNKYKLFTKAKAFINLATKLKENNYFPCELKVISSSNGGGSCYTYESAE